MTGTGSSPAAGGWYATLPTVYLAAAALITDPADRVLLVKPNYRDLWALPGGICEHGEPPHEGCAREVLEEIGLPIPAGRLLVLSWTPPDSKRPKPIMHLVFDGGMLPDGNQIRLQHEELDDFEFVSIAALPSYLAPNLTARVTAAITARATGTPVYLACGAPYPAAP